VERRGERDDEREEAKEKARRRASNARHIKELRGLALLWRVLTSSRI